MWTTENVYGILVNLLTFSDFEETLIESKLVHPVLRQPMVVLAAALTMMIILMSCLPMMAAESADSVDALQSRIKATSDRST